jgi:hypothetical protein
MDDSTKADVVAKVEAAGERAWCTLAGRMSRLWSGANASTRNVRSVALIEVLRGAPCSPFSAPACSCSCFPCCSLTRQCSSETSPDNAAALPPPRGHRLITRLQVITIIIDSPAAPHLCSRMLPRTARQAWIDEPANVAVSLLRRPTHSRLNFPDSPLSRVLTLDPFSSMLVNLHLSSTYLPYTCVHSLCLRTDAKGQGEDPEITKLKLQLQIQQEKEVSGRLCYCMSYFTHCNFKFWSCESSLK